MHPVRKIFHARPRLIVGLIAGIAVTAFLPGDYRLTSRALAGWDTAVWIYLLAVWFLMMRATPGRVKTIALREDESAEVVLTVICVAAITSVAAIVFELATSKELAFETRLLHYAFTAVTVLGCWCLLPTIFALHYARLFYGVSAPQPPLLFPDQIKNPDYWDFLYFAFTIAVASQTADVAIATRPMRKAVLAQSVLAFFFNAAILGLSINIAAGVVGS